MRAKAYKPIDEFTHRGRPLREILDSHRLWIESSGRMGSKADLLSAKLLQVDLHGCDLRFAILNMTLLSGANLSQTQLYAASLQMAQLVETDLSGADLTSTNFKWSNMIGANLRGANLDKAVFDSTELAAADFSRAVMGSAVFLDCDLGGVIGLGSVHHRAPSSIGVDTILRSRGMIPEAFLEGTGIPGTFIKHLKDFVREIPTSFDSCFICHSHTDQEFAARLLDNLRAKGVRCWYFPEDATWGKSVWEEIDGAVKRNDRLVVVCSENSLNSGPVIREIERALQREDSEKRDVLFPIRIDDYLFEGWEHPRKADVIAKVVGDFRGWKDRDVYKKNFENLLKALNRKQAA